MSKNKEYGLTIMIGICAGAILVLSLQYFVKNYEVRSPIVFQNPVVKRNLITPLPTGKQIISPLPQNATNSAFLKPSPTKIPKRTLVPQVQAEEIEILHADIYDKVSMLESRRGKDLSGKHGTCVKKGMTNTIGYAPQIGYCFASKTDEMISLGRWFQKYFDKGWDLNGALCAWNLGPNSEEAKKGMCKYVTDYHSIK